MALSDVLLRRVQARKDDDDLSELHDEASEDDQLEDKTGNAPFDAHLANRDADDLDSSDNNLDELDENGAHTNRYDEPDDEIAQHTSDSIEHSEAEVSARNIIWA